MWIVMLLFLMGGQKINPSRLIVKVKKDRTLESLKFIEDRYDVKFIRRLFPETDKTNKKLYEKYRLGDYYVVDFSSKGISFLEKVKNLILETNLFDNAEFDYKIQPLYSPDDPKLFLQWAFPIIKADVAWDISKGSKNVKIVVDDTGVDWKHEDLVDNLWQNLGEDADGDGHVIEFINGEWQFDPGDINGNDDDGDGLVDDFIGWNFYSNSNDPEPDPNQDGYYHGTHVAGISSAVSDNSIGIASVAFSASIVASRSYWISNSANALQWAADMGFDIFNMSWGTTSDLSYLRSAINYAHDAGVLLVAAAGNDASSDSTVNWPAAYSNVIAVAATNRNDQHSYYTNYGTWVDIAAPGGDYYVDPMIYSTMPDNSYDYLQGTSMASPMLASVAALVKSANPFLSNDNIRDILFSTADSIDDTLYQQGLLGAGRVNAYRAVLEAAKQIRGFVIADSIEVIPDRPVEGDTVVFNISVLDSAGWQQVTDLVVRLSSDNPDFILLDSIASVGDLSAGSSAQVTFRGVVPSGFVPSKVHFVISYSSSGYIVERTDEFDRIIGHPYVLVVDGAKNSGAYAEYYSSSLDTLGLVYDLCDVQIMGIPPVNGKWGLTSYKAIIWFTGDDTLTLTQEEIDTLIAAIDGGANLFISSQNLAEVWNGSVFLRDYLGAGFDQSGASDIFIKGVAGDPLGDSMSLVVAGAGGAQNATSKDIIHADGTGVVFLNYGSNGTNGGAGVHNEKGSAKIVFVSFPFEAINGQVTGQNSRVEFLGKVLSWMGVTSIHERKKNITNYRQKDIIVGRGTGILRLSDIYKGTRRFIVYSISGRKMFEVEDGNLHLEKLSSGIYFIEIPKLQKNIKLLKIK